MRCLLAAVWLLAASVAAAAAGGDVASDDGAWGASVPLNALTWGNGMRLSIGVTPASGPGEVVQQQQQLVLDSGSSTLAFCDTSLAAKVDARRLPYLSCNRYNPGGVGTGYWGYFYEGALDMEGVMLVNSSRYSIMEQESHMPCDLGFDGIFGIAFHELNLAFRDEGSLSWAPGTAGQCPKPSEAVDFVQPLMKTIKARGPMQQIGIHWSGKLGHEEGRLYLDSSAADNPHRAATTPVGKAQLVELGFYNVQIQQISYLGNDWVGNCNPVSAPCVMDTGTPVLVVPKELYSFITAAYAAGQPLDTLTFQLAGADGGSPVLVEFDMEVMLQNDWIQGGDKGIILGLPLWASYYTVFDIAAKAVEFYSKEHRTPQDKGLNVAIPLGATAWGNGTRLTVGVTPAGSAAGDVPEQTMLLDTGSSTLVFCNASVVESWAERLNYTSCGAYNPGGAPTGYWGYLYEGSLDVEGQVVLNQSTFSTMEQWVGMPCTEGFDGIFGVAFRQLNPVFHDQGPLHWPEGNTSACPPRSAVADWEREPLLNTLARKGDPEMVGIYWSGELGDNQGTLYLDRAAIANPHHAARRAVGRARMGELGFYSVAVQQIVLGNEALTGIDCGPSSPCIMDTGTPGIVVPKKVHDFFLTHYRNGVRSLQFQLAGAPGFRPVVLDFDLVKLVENQWLAEGESLILGLPLFAYYYTVFDIKNGAVQFFANVPSGPAPGPPYGPPRGPPRPPQVQPRPPKVGELDVSLPLGATLWGNSARLTVGVSPAGVPQQQLVLDTGSSTLAFCNTSIAASAPLERLPYLSCNKYNPGGTPLGYWGYFYNGTLDVEGEIVLNQSHFSIMEQESHMPCQDGLSGIFGIAFYQLDLAFPDEGRLDWPVDAEGSAAVQCPAPGTAEGAIREPLLDTLKRSGAMEQIGIYWSGQLGDDQGRLYLERAATTNQHYNAHLGAGVAALGERGFYSVNVQQIEWGFEAFYGLDCSAERPCIMDTGTPSLVIPRQLYHLISTAAFNAVPLGSIAFQLEGAPGAPPVLLEFDVAGLLHNGWLEPGDQVILGLPVWAAYYTVFHLREHAVEFFSLLPAAPSAGAWAMRTTSPAHDTAPSTAPSATPLLRGSVTSRAAVTGLPCTAAALAALLLALC